MNRWHRRFLGTTSLPSELTDFEAEYYFTLTLTLTPVAAVQSRYKGNHRIAVTSSGPGERRPHVAVLAVADEHVHAFLVHSGDSVADGFSTQALERCRRNPWQLCRTQWRNIA